MAEHGGQPDRIEIDWRELYRCNDRDRAMSVTTSIAAMGFEVECGDAGGAPAACSRGGCGSGGTVLGDPPYVVRVLAADLPELGPVLEEIIAEQVEFDRALAQSRLRGRQLRHRVVLTALIAVVLILGLLGLLRL